MIEQQERDTEREAFEAWADDQGFLLQRLDIGDGDDYHDVRTQSVWEAWQAHAARSQQQQRGTPISLRVLRSIFEAGWRTAANWMERDDLIADIGSPAYIHDRDAALSDLTGGGNG